MNARIGAFLAATLAAGGAVAEDISRPLTMEEQRQRYLATVPEWGEPARQMEQYRREVEAASSSRPGRAYSLDDTERRSRRLAFESLAETLSRSCAPYCGSQYHRPTYYRHHKHFRRYGDHRYFRRYAVPR